MKDMRRSAHCASIKVWRVSGRFLRGSSVNPVPIRTGVQYLNRSRKERKEREKKTRK